MSHDLGAWLRYMRDVMALKKRHGRKIRYVMCDDSTNELKRWNFRSEDRPRLTVVVATYQQDPALDCLLKSLACQTLQNFRILVIHDGPSATARSIADATASARPGLIEYIETPS